MSLMHYPVTQRATQGKNTDANGWSRQVLHDPGGARTDRAEARERNYFGNCWAGVTFWARMGRGDLLGKDRPGAARASNARAARSGPVLHSRRRPVKCQGSLAARKIGSGLVLA